MNFLETMCGANNMAFNLPTNYETYIWFLGKEIHLRLLFFIAATELFNTFFSFLFLKDLLIIWQLDYRDIYMEHQIGEEH